MGGGELGRRMRGWEGQGRPRVGRGGGEADRAAPGPVTVPSPALPVPCPARLRCVGRGRGETASAALLSPAAGYGGSTAAVAEEESLTVGDGGTRRGAQTTVSYTSTRLQPLRGGDLGVQPARPQHTSLYAGQWLPWHSLL